MMCPKISIFFTIIIWNWFDKMASGFSLPLLECTLWISIVSVLKWTNLVRCLELRFVCNRTNLVRCLELRFVCNFVVCFGMPPFCYVLDSEGCRKYFVLFIECPDSYLSSTCASVTGHKNCNDCQNMISYSASFFFRPLQLLDCLVFLPSKLY